MLSEVDLFADPVEGIWIVEFVVVQVEQMLLGSDSG